MNIVVDTNIIFSGLLSPLGSISDLLLNSSDGLKFYAPSFLEVELEKHQEKILLISGLSERELHFLKNRLLRKVHFIHIDSISKSSWEKAIELTQGVDEDDAPFIALALELGTLLWTGDKKLINGLKNKGIEWVIPTEMIAKLRF